MFVVITYDIADPKRLQTVASCCCDYGTRVQYSVFEARLSRTELATLMSRIEELIDAVEDKVRYYMICSECHTHTQCKGDSSEPLDDDTLVIL